MLLSMLEVACGLCYIIGHIGCVADTIFFCHAYEEREIIFMSTKQKGRWGSRLTFILAAVGSAVGLGNAWRFPGLMAAHGGAAFLIAYLIAMVVMGVPLLTMEIALGRRMHAGAIGAIRAVNKKMEPVGWAATANAFLIVTYYSVVFAWVLMMCGISYKFAGMVGDNDAAGGLFLSTIKTTGTTSGWTTIPLIVVLALAIAWGLQYFCIRDGANSVGKVVKYTVFVPVFLLLLMAIKGLTMPSAGASMAKMFIPDVQAFADAGLWVDAFTAFPLSWRLCLPTDLIWRIPLISLWMQ